MQAAKFAINTSDIATPISLDAASIPFPMAILSAKDGHVLYANSLLATLLSEKDEKKLIGKSIAGLYDNVKQREDFFKQVKKNTVIPAKHIQLKRADKTSIRVALTARLTHFNNSSCILITLQDTSQQGEQISSMRNELVRQSVALRAAEVGIWSWNWTTKKVVWDDIMHDLFGLQRGTYSGSEKEFFERIHPEDRDDQYRQRTEFRKSKESNVFESQYRIVRPDGETRVITMRGTAEKNPDNLITVAVGACWDVTHSYAVAAKLEHQVLFDPLTKLLNRSELQRRLRKMLTRLQDEYSENVFCYFDIDRFKVINETCGHKAGDVLLQEVSEILRNHVKKADTLARMGGDEFGLLLQNCSTNNAKKVAEILCKAIDEFHFEWDGNVFYINISMGLIGVTADHQSVSRVLSLADIALSAAKDSGGNRIHVYHPYDSTLTRRHEEMQSIVELESALHENRFKLFAQSIQPIANNTHEGLHYEVLLRVIDAFGEVVMPGELLSADEHFDLATRVDKWVINAVFDWLKNNPAHCEKLSLCSINLSGTSIGDPRFIDYIHRKLQDKAIPCDKIGFEVTETAAIKNIKRAAEFIKAIKWYGCTFALDDFGSGLSSFAYLKDLPVDMLKIDGMFVQGVNVEQVNYAMVKAINDVGKIMGMKTIAEYVENEEVFAKLKEIGVDYGQGYYFAEAEALDQMLTPGM